MKTLTRTKAFLYSFITSAFLLAFTTNVNAERLVAVNGDNQIGIFDSTDANIDVSFFKTITGIGPNNYFVGIDLRPSTNSIYGITSDNKIYTLNPFTGASSFIANLSQSIVVIPDVSYGLDIDPITDRTPANSIRLVSSLGGNFSINAVTGAVTVETSIIPGFAGVAYRNSDASTPLIAPASTELYYLNTVITSTLAPEDGILASAQSEFDNPTISTIGLLGANICGSINGFEITRLGNAYGSSVIPELSATALFTIDLNTGAATPTGIFRNSITAITGLTSAPVSAIPEPKTYAMLLLGLGLIGFVAHRRQVRSQYHADHISSY